MVTTQDIAVNIINEYRNIHAGITQIEELLEILNKRRSDLSEKLLLTRQKEAELLVRIKQDTGHDFNLIEFIQSLQNDQE